MKKWLRHKQKQFLRVLTRTLVPRLGNALIALLLKTCRLRVEGLEEFLQCHENGPCILVLWHNRIALMPRLLSQLTPQIPYTAVASKSRDGELIARATEQFSNGQTIRVASRSKHQALKAIVKALKARQVVIFTPDGPRGPKYSIKPGVFFAAHMGRASLVPVSWHSSRCWKLSTWDALRIPYPFSQITLRFASPYTLTNFSKDDTGCEEESLREALHQAALDKEDIP